MNAIVFVVVTGENWKRALEHSSLAEIARDISITRRRIIKGVGMAMSREQLVLTTLSLQQSAIANVSEGGLFMIAGDKARMYQRLISAKTVPAILTAHKTQPPASIKDKQKAISSLVVSARKLSVRIASFLRGQFLKVKPVVRRLFDDNRGTTGKGQDIIRAKSEVTQKATEANLPKPARHPDRGFISPGREIEQELAFFSQIDLQKTAMTLGIATQEEVTKLQQVIEFRRKLLSLALKQQGALVEVPIWY